MANGLEEFLGPELTERVRVLVVGFIEQQERAVARQAEYEAARAAAEATAQAPMSVLDVGSYDPEAEAVKNLRQTLFITCVSQGAAPDMAWTRAAEAATFYVARCKELGETVGHSIARGIF